MRGQNSSAQVWAVIVSECDENWAEGRRARPVQLRRRQCREDRRHLLAALSLTDWRLISRVALSHPLPSNNKTQTPELADQK